MSDSFEAVSVDDTESERWQCVISISDTASEVYAISIADTASDMYATSINESTTERWQCAISMGKTVSEMCAISMNDTESERWQYAISMPLPKCTRFRSTILNQKGGSAPFPKTWP